MRILFCSLFFFFFSNSFTTDKKEYPTDYFRSPVDHPIKLSGTFGELRTNHLHAGIDIKSKDGKIGHPLYAIADGHVSRIKVSAGGYGKVLYIDHPNGYTSVFAHLQKFRKDIDDFVKQQQYAKQTFEIELFPQPGAFKITKSEVIGKMGLSGRSFGPHLHFEIRDTKSEKPINPLLFGIAVKDNIRPKLHNLKVYHLNDKREEIGTKAYSLVKTKSGDYRIKGDTISIGAWRCGFALKAYDHMNGASNWNGVYSIAMSKDDVPFYDFEMETFSFDETRYINAHLDYGELKSKKSYYNRCFALPGNKLSIYKNVKEEKGVVKLYKDKATKIVMDVKDAEGNTSKLTFWAKRGNVKDPNSSSFNYILKIGEENIIDNNNLYLYFPKGALYENLYMNYHTSSEASYNIYSQVHHIHNYKSPVHKYFDIGIKGHHVPDEFRDKAFIANCDKDGEIINCGGKWDGSQLKTKAREFGDYSIMLDKTPPKIEPKSFKKDLRGVPKMTFKITDNYEVARNVPNMKYYATVDGNWILMEYDSKKDLLIHHFDGSIGKGEHQLVITVSDNLGNTSVLERTFLK